MSAPTLNLPSVQPSEGSLISPQTHLRVSEGTFLGSSVAQVVVGVCILAGVSIPLIGQMILISALALAILGSLASIKWADKRIEVENKLNRGSIELQSPDPTIRERLWWQARRNSGEWDRDSVDSMKGLTEEDREFHFGPPAPTEHLQMEPLLAPAHHHQIGPPPFREVSEAVQVEIVGMPDSFDKLFGEPPISTAGPVLPSNLTATLSGKQSCALEHLHAHEDARTVWYSQGEGVETPNPAATGSQVDNEVLATASAGFIATAAAFQVVTGVAQIAVATLANAACLQAASAHNLQNAKAIPDLNRPLEIEILPSASVDSSPLNQIEADSIQRAPVEKPKFTTQEVVNRIHKFPGFKKLIKGKDIAALEFRLTNQLIQAIKNGNLDKLRRTLNALKTELGESYAEFLKAYKIKLVDKQVTKPHLEAVQKLLLQEIAEAKTRDVFEIRRIRYETIRNLKLEQYEVIRRLKLREKRRRAEEAIRTMEQNLLTSMRVGTLRVDELDRPSHSHPRTGLEMIREERPLAPESVVREELNHLLSLANQLVSKTQSVARSIYGRIPSWVFRWEND